MQARWDELSRKRWAGTLSEAEQQEWEHLARLIEQEEQAILRPALQRYENEAEELERAIADAQTEKTQLLKLLEECRQYRAQLETRIQELEQEYQQLAAQKRQRASLSSKE